MKLIVGLGNPGKKYEHTRHNVGFMVLDKLTRKFSFDKKLNSEIRKEKDRIYLKPQAFMNLSGQAVSKAASYYKIKPKDIWVTYDDIDLPVGVLRIRKNGSSAGHKGIESIIEALGTNEFARFRIGISRSETMQAEKYVLQKFDQKDTEIINDTVKKTAVAINFAINNGLDETISKFS